MTGGCALNVLVNEKIKNFYDRPVYVPPNPHDGGLSLGHIFLALNEELDLYPNADSLRRRSSKRHYICRTSIIRS